MTETVLLPTSKIKASSASPRKLIIYSKPKVGKTSALADLKDSLIFDLEKGTNFLDAVKVQPQNLTELKAFGEAIIAAGKPYKCIIVDTVTKLEDMCAVLALQLYKQTPMGKSFAGTNVLMLPNGAGYLYLREAVESVTSYIETLADRVIYSGHIKLKAIEKQGKEISALDLDLTGKIKSMMSADADAIGMLYRDGNKAILSFKTTDEIICGARPKHLKNQEIVLSEMNEKGDLKVFWDKIFVD